MLELSEPILSGDFFWTGISILIAQIVLTLVPLVVVICLWYKKSEQLEDSQSTHSYKLLALTLLIHVLYVSIALAFLISTLGGSELPMLSKGMNSILRIYGDDAGRIPSLMTERGGRGCFDNWMFGWGYQFDQWTKEQKQREAERQR